MAQRGKYTWQKDRINGQSLQVLKFPKVIIKGKPDQQEQAHHPLRSSLQLVDPAIQLRHKGFYTLTNEDKNN